DRGGGGDERERRRDDLVPRTDAGGEERQVQCARPRVDRDGVRRRAIGGEFALERFDFGTEHVMRTLEHPVDGRFDLVSDARVLRFQIEKRNYAAHRFASSSMIWPRWCIDSLAASRIRTTRSPA